MTSREDCTRENPCDMCIDGRAYAPPTTPFTEKMARDIQNRAQAAAGSGALGHTPSPDPRKATPIFSGVMRYFPLALAAVARLSKAGNDKHNPGEKLHWSREKSTDHGDCIARHQITFDKVDDETGEYHAAAVAWRALAQLELLEEAKTAPKPDGGWMNMGDYGSVPERARGLRIDIRLRDGRIMPNVNANIMCWRECGRGTIVAYRPARP